MRSVVLAAFGRLALALEQHRGDGIDRLRRQICVCDQQTVDVGGGQIPFRQRWIASIAAFRDAARIDGRFSEVQRRCLLDRDQLNIGLLHQLLDRYVTECPYPENGTTALLINAHSAERLDMGSQVRSASLSP